MASSWAKMVGSGPRLPTPQQRLDALATFYRSQKMQHVLLEALGAYPTYLRGMPDIATPLVDHMIIICVDTESSTNNTDLLTEVGLNQFKRSDGRAVAANPGAYGVRIMEQLRFLHFRVVENAHLLSNREGSLGPLGNRFGHTRFTTFQELRVVLRHLFNQPIQSDNPALKGCMRPVVLVGHALKHDIENGTKEGLDYNFAANSTIVAKVDTQQLARDLGVWIPPPDMRTNEIGLRVLIQEKAKFLHLDDHTACNDAARTMMCAIWMVLPTSLTQNQARTMQEVANRIEMRSQVNQVNSPNPFGTVECCTRCGGRDHSVDDCAATVKCAACDRFDAGPNRDENVASHIETYCPHVARFKAWARRYKDAYIKNEANGRPFSAEVLAGPGPEAHPWSTWRKPGRPYWPLKQLKEVLEGMAMSKEPDAFVYNLQSALGGLPVPSTGNWVMGTSHGSTKSRTASAMAPVVNSATSASTNGNAASTAGLPPLPTAVNITALAPAPTATRVVRMSDQRGRARAGGVRSRGGSSNPRGDRGGGHGGDAAASALEQGNYGFYD